MKKRVIITGGAGFIGSHLANKLVKKGFEVIVYDNLSNGSGRKNLLKNVKIVQGSILNFQKMKTCFKKASTIFNLAVLPLPMSFDNPQRVIRVNDWGSYLVCKACTELEKKLVHISSSEVYGDGIFFPMKESHPILPTTIYAASKSASDAYVYAFSKTYGMRFVIVRPFNSYGEFMREDSYGAAIPNFYKRITINKCPIIHGTGNQTRDLTYVEDTVEGIYLASINPKALGGTFNIGQGKETSIKNLAKIMLKKYSKISGKSLKLELQFTKGRLGDVNRHLADISNSSKVLGYKPKISLEDGLEKYIIWQEKKLNRIRKKRVKRIN